MPEKISDKWETPQELFDRLHYTFAFDLDAAAQKSNAKVQNYFGLDKGALADALEVDWADYAHRIFVNPPLSPGAGPLERWVQKMLEAAEAGCLVVAVLPATPNVGWFHDYVAGRAAVWFPRARIKYKAPEGIPTTYVDEKTGKTKRRNGARHDSMIVVWVGGLLKREELPGWWA